MMTPAEQQLLETALLAAKATHCYWLATRAICEEIFNQDVQGIKHAIKVNHNIDGYGTQSKELSAKVVELSEAIEG